MKSSRQYNAELRARLNKLSDRFQQIEISRRTGVPAPNVHRYLRSGRIPAEFCLALIDAFDLSPDWLLRGEGEPVTSDVRSSTAAKAGELLELVQAMNAVARLRLGAVVGDRDRKKLRELSETLDTFDRLRTQMNDKSRPVLSQLLDDLRQALNAFEMPRARVLRETAVELSRLCADELLLERFDSLQSEVEYLTGHVEQALHFERRVFAHRVREGRMHAGGEFGQSLHLVMMLRETGRMHEARRVCGAMLSLHGDESDNAHEVLEARMFMGSFDVELGELSRGLELMRRVYPRIAPNRRVAATILLVRALVFAGLMDYHEAFAFGLRSAGSARSLLRLACFREDADMLRHALGSLLGRGADEIPPEEYDAQRAKLLLGALGGKGKVDDFDRMAEAHPPVVAGANLLRMNLALHRGQFARLLGDKRALSACVKEAQQAFEAQPAEITPRCEFQVEHFRNMQGVGRPQQALQVQLQQLFQQGYVGLVPATVGNELEREA